MSRDHSSIAHEINHLVHEVQNLSKDEVKSLFGIEFRSDGSIYDPTYQTSFATIGEWAQFSVEQDHVEYSEDFHDHTDYI